MVFRHSRSFYDASGSLDRDARHMLQESQGQIPGTTLGANIDSTVVVKNVDLQSLGPGQNKYSIHENHMYEVDIEYIIQYMSTCHSSISRLY